MRSSIRVSLSSLACLAVAIALFSASTASAATVWNKIATAGGPYYWYDDYTAPDGTNEATNMGASGNGNTNWSGGIRATDFHLVYGYDYAGSGVVFDPSNDPWVNGTNAGPRATVGAADGTGAGTVTLANPFVVAGAGSRLYIGTTQNPIGNPSGGDGVTNNSNTNKLTIRSGTMQWAEQIRVTRYTSTTTPLSNVNITTSATGIIVQEKGPVGNPTKLIVDGTATGPYMSLGDGDQLPAGQTTPTTVTGIYDYRGGSLEIGLTNTTIAGLRLGSPSAGAGPNDKNYRHVGTVIINPDDVDAGGGHVRVSNYVSGVGNNGDGSSTNITYTLATTEFHYQNAGAGHDGTRPIQILGDLSIRNTDPNVNPSFGDLAIGSSRLDVVLDEAPTMNGADSIDGLHLKPMDLALFDVDFDGNGTNGTTTGTTTNGDQVTADGSQGPARFYSVTAAAAGSNHLYDETTGAFSLAGAGLLNENDIVSITQGGQTYKWRIHYDGQINYSDADNSVISSITPHVSDPDGAGPLLGGQDVVLIGYTSTLTNGLGNNGDFDDNGVVNAADIDILWHIVRGTGTDPGSNDTADLNGDGFVNEDDVDKELATQLTAGAGRHYGDADLVGGVGPDDFTAWRIGGSGWAHGDFDGTGDVGPDDFTLWRTAPTTYPGTVGPHAGDALAAVPEPATVVLMGLALPGLALAIRRRKV